MLLYIQGEEMTVDEAGEAVVVVDDRNLGEKIVDWAWSYAPNILGAILIFLIGRWIAKALTGVLRRLMTARNVEATLTGFLGSLAYFVLLTMVVIAAIGRLGVNTTSFVAILGAATLALGLALQGTLGDVASGVMLILFRPFRVGDFVETAGGTGVVEEIGIFTTHMKTADNKAIIVPNGSITGGTVTNYSAKDTRRVDLVFGIGYGDDLRRAKTTLQELCDADERVLKDPAVTIAVGELGESSVNLLCRPWVKSADYWAVYWDLQEQVKLTFDERGISIPFPQRDVHLFQETA
jgi:small conductance mechanosensitive channel